jgi:choline-sulfatase
MSARKPHLIVIMADQLAAAFLPPYGHKVVKTPVLSRLAEEGVVFENAYTPSPLCAPARAAIMNGLLPSRTGVYDNAAEFPSAIPTWAHYLRLHGYRTCLSGKMHFVGPDQLHGFEERLTTDIYPADFGWTPDWRRGEERIDWWYHNMTSPKQAGMAEITNQLEYDDEVCFHAVRKIYDHARYDPAMPLGLLVSFTHPHDPYVARRAFWNLYLDDEIDMPKTAPIPLAAMDAHSKRLVLMAEMDKHDIGADDIRASRHGYYANISYIDGLIGKLIETLRVTGLLEDSIIVFTSDHGDFLGERGLWYKMSFLDYSARVPLVVWRPGIIRSRRSAAPVCLTDLLPTFVDAATDGKGELSRDVDGTSLWPLLCGGPESPDATAWGEYLAEGALAPIHMLRRGRWKFIHSPIDPDQLYDLAADPEELVNLANRQPERAAAFRSEIEAKFDIGKIHANVLASQRARLMLFEAMKRGALFPWDFQPLRKASEQYTRNHMAVTDRDEKSRFPPFSAD